MADKIQIPLEVTGIPKSKKEVEELLDKIKILELALGSMADKETAAYKETEQAVNKLKGAVDAYNGSTGQKNIENTAKSFVKIGSAITSSFAAAQAALSLFGTESEDVAKAAAKAQGLLTLALASREIAEAGAAVKTVILTTATIVQTAATQGLTAATRLLFATFAANPLGALLTVLGLVIGAIVTFTDDTDDAADATSNYNTQLERLNTTYEAQIALLQAQGATEVDIARKRVQRAQETKELADAEFARLQRESRFSEGTEKARQEAIKRNNELNVANAALKRAIDKEAEDTANKLNEQDKKISEERKQRLLEQLRLQGELRRVELDRLTQGLQVELPEIGGGLKDQNEFLKSLAKSQMEYNDAFEEYAKLIQGLSPNQVAELYKIPVEAQNAIKINRELIKSSLELAGLESNTQASLLRDLLFTQSQFLEGVYDNTEGYKKNQEDLLKFERDFIKSFVDTQIRGFVGSTEAVAEQRKILTEQAKTVFANLIENGNQLVKVNKFYDDAAEKIKNLTKENKELSQSTEVLNGFLQKNNQLLVASFTLPIQASQQSKQDILDIEKEIATGRFDTAKRFASDIEVLEYTLLKEGIDIRNASYEEKLKLLKSFLEKEVKETEDAEGKKQAAQQKTIEKFRQNVQLFQQTLNSFGQALGDYYELQFMKIENGYNELQKSINDSTEAGQQKRLEAEKIYNEQVSALQKKQAKAQLRIALAQTLANTAEAASKINAQLGAFGIVAQAAITASGLAQAGIIIAQLGQIDSFKKGGRLPKMAGGGYLQGPSHDMGGIKYAQGGVELEGREAVINRLSTVQYADLLSSINMAGGGRPIMMNNFDDSRIVEAIARQRKEPIRAYVVESDITGKQTVTKRLEQLSQI
jgi:hypothetical protein